MEKEFIPYTEALQLKQLGFDEHCMGIWHGEAHHLAFNIDMMFDQARAANRAFHSILAPLYQQAFRWFRAKYGILHDIDFGIGWGYGFIPVGNFKNVKIPTNFTEGFNTYEEAQLACLKELIKIVQDDKKV